MIRKIISVAIVLSIYVQQAGAQGCSDAGFCTAGSIGEVTTGQEEDTLSSQRNHRFRITQSVGLGEDKVKIIATYLDFYLQLHERVQFQVRGPIQLAINGDTKAVSVGDILLVNTFSALNSEAHSVQANIGVKLPTNQANLTFEGTALPMNYQSSLGTFDLIAGVNHTWKHKLGNLKSGFAYQQPFVHINHNQSAASRELKRKADILVRLDQTFSVKGKFDIGAGLLYIYHTRNDTRLNGADMRVEIPGSQGSTLNITGVINGYVGSRVQIGAAFGMPIIVRDARPDGLTREFVVNPYVQFGF